MKRITKKLRRRLSWTPLREAVVAWRHLGLSGQDAFIASYPKSGNTWLKHMLVHLLTGAEHDFYGGGRDSVIPYVGRHSATPLRTPLGGRILKTHERYRRRYRHVLYVVRDGRDVAVSNYWFHCRKQQRQLDVAEFMRMFLDGRINAYGSWADNVRSWMRSPLWDSPNLVLVRYEDLHREPVQAMRRVCSMLDIEVDEETLESVVTANSFNSMQQRESATPA